MPQASTVTATAHAGPGVYRPRRTAATLLHRTVRENLETFLSRNYDPETFFSSFPRLVQAAFGDRLRCGILAHGFVRVYCAGCGHDFLVAFSCMGRDICPSCATRRMVETAAHMVDEVLLRVPYRQWVLSVQAGALASQGEA